MKILVFGNPLVEQDSLPLRLLPLLRKNFPQVEFKESDSAESLENEGPDLLILDTARGVEQVIVLDDIGMIEASRAVSMHDFDLAITLKIMKKVGMLASVRIIAVPAGYPEKKAFEETKKIISSLLSGSG